MENIQNYRKSCPNLREDGKCMMQSDLSGVSTADLVRELERRDTDVLTVSYPETEEIGLKKHETWIDNLQYHCPAKVLVVFK